MAEKSAEFLSFRVHASEVDVTTSCRDKDSVPFDVQGGTTEAISCWETRSMLTPVHTVEKEFSMATCLLSVMITIGSI